MEVWSGGVPGLADATDLLATTDGLALAHRDPGHMVVGRVEPGAVGDPDLVTAPVVLPAGEDHGTRTRGTDGRTIIGGDVQAGVPVVEELADVVAATDDRPEQRSTGVGGRWSARAARITSIAGGRSDLHSGHGLGDRDRLAGGAGHDQHLADHEVRVAQLVRGQDFGRGDLVVRRDAGQGVFGGDVHDQPIDRRDTQHLADVEGILGRQMVGPPDSHHRDSETGGDPGQGVARLDLVRAQQLATIVDCGVDGDRLEKRAVSKEWARDARVRPGDGATGADEGVDGGQARARRATEGRVAVFHGTGAVDAVARTAADHDARGRTIAGRSARGAGRTNG